MLTLPGLIDAHVHLRDPGQTDKEDLTSGTASAISGGFTTILDMPNNTIPITTEKLLLDKQKTAQTKIFCDVGFYFGSLGDNFKEFKKIQDKVHGLKLFLNQTTGNFIINLNTFQKICDAWPYPQTSGKPILLHAEENILQKTLEIGHQANQRLHVCHVSSEKELRIILNAKNKGWKVTCGVTPHHLFLSQNDLSTIGDLGNVKPNLRPPSDVNFLWQHLKDIDIIESDHAPHTIQEKGKGAYGFPGLETTLPLLLTAAHQKKLTIEDITRLCHTNPAKIFGIPPGNGHLGGGRLKRSGSHDSPEVGSLQTRIEIDENEEWTIKNKNLLTKAKWSPFNGWKVKGKIKKVFIRGAKVFENGKILAQPGFGKII